MAWIAAIGEYPDIMEGGSGSGWDGNLDPGAD